MDTWNTALIKIFKTWSLKVQKDEKKRFGTLSKNSGLKTFSVDRKLESPNFFELSLDLLWPKLHEQPLSPLLEASINHISLAEGATGFYIFC